MKKIFVCEFITGGGMCDQELNLSLLADAQAMVGALLNDLADIDELEVLTCRDYRTPRYPGHVHTLGPGEDPWSTWEHYMGQAELIWIIAPETDGILGRLSCMARQSGATVIGCDEAAIALTSSKLATARRLAEYRLATPDTRPLQAPLVKAEHGWVVKPDDGAGSEACFRFRTRSDLSAWLDKVPAGKTFIQQPYIDGRHLSISAFFSPVEAEVLACNNQVSSESNGRLRSRVERASTDVKNTAPFTALVQQLTTAIPGLRGYVGIDIVISDGSAIVLDINPRLTTSYAGLSGRLGANLAQRLINSFLRQVDNECSPRRLAGQAG